MSWISSPTRCSIPLLFDELPAPVPAAPPTAKGSQLKLHHPVQREYSEEDVTVVGRTADLLASLADHEDDGTSGLEELASADVDQLLSSMPASAPPASAEAQREIPRLPDVPPAPRVPAVPRPASRMPSMPGSSFEATAKPPSVNPSGPPARQPFPPAMSPRAPVARESLAKFGAPRSGPGPEGPSPASLATTSPPPAPPASLAAPASVNTAAPPASAAAPRGASSIPEEDEEERTRIFRQGSSANLEPSAPEMLGEPPVVASEPSNDPRSSMPTLQQIDPERMPTLSVAEPDAPLSMPAIPGPQGLPTATVRDSEFELFPDTPEPIGTDALDELADFSELTGQSEQPRGPLDSVDFSPLPVHSSIPPSVWPDERPAKDHLAAQHEAWITRAEWFENEAQAASDAQAKTRLLIVASELWALVGDLSPRA